MGTHEKPSREASVVVLVGSESELQRVDPMGELRTSLPVRLGRGVDPARLVVRLRHCILGEDAAGERVAGSAAQAAPDENVRLGVIEVPRWSR
jgi:hypothetical protein